MKSIIPMKSFNLDDIDEMPTMLHFDEEELPEIKKWKVGGKYTLLVDVEQTGLHKDPAEEGEMEADFKVIKVTENKETIESAGGNYDAETVSKAVSKQG